MSVPWPTHKDLLALYGELNEEILSKCTVAVGCALQIHRRMLGIARVDIELHEPLYRMVKCTVSHGELNEEILT